MDSWNNGPHLLEFEAPDIFHCHVRGQIEEDEAKETVRIIKEELIGKRHLPVVYFVAHMEASGSLNPYTPGGRKYISSMNPVWNAIIVVGGNAMVRAATNIVVSGMMLFSHHKIPFKMLKSMDEARAYIAELRKQQPAHAAASNG